MAVSQHGLVLLYSVVVSLLVQSSGTVVGPNTTTIQCEEGKEGCSDCYITLVKYVIYDDSNVFRLSKTFLPPTIEAPVFVKVVYNFETANDSTWYWTTETSTFLHPVQGFQFFSLLFSTYDWLTNEVSVTLPDECADADPKYFELLTQRLKIYISSSESTSPVSGEDYDAYSANMDTLADLRVDKVLVAVLYLYQIVIPLLVLIVVGLTLHSESMHEKIDYYLPNDNIPEKHGRVFSLVVLAVTLVLFALAMDMFGIIKTMKLDYYRDAPNNSALKNILLLPFTVLTFYDSILVIALILSLIILLLCTVAKNKCEWCYELLKCQDSSSDFNFCKIVCACWCSGKSKSSHWEKHSIIAAVSLVAIITMVSNHSYYVIVALINDPYHANSVGIYFVAVIAMYLYLLKLFWKIVIEKIITANGDNTERSRLHVCCLCFILSCYTLMFVVVVLSILTLVTAVFVYYIPIKHSSEDIPQQINSISRTLTLLFAGLILYLIFYKKSDKQLLKDILEQVSIANEWVMVCDHEEKSSVCEKKKLTNKDKINILEENSPLDDRIIHAAMLLIKNAKPDITGLVDPAELVTEESKVKHKGSLKANGLQILHTGENHWITVTTIGTTAGDGYVLKVHVYNSSNKTILELTCTCGCINRNPRGYNETGDRISDEQKSGLEEDTIRLIENLLDKDPFNIEWEKHTKVQKQDNSSDGGLFAIAFAFEICKGEDAAEALEQRRFATENNAMRKHLVNCFEKEEMKSFPLIPDV